MMAVVVSAANKCPYCMQHHSEALNHFWKDDEKISSLANDFNNTELSKADEALCKYAHDLTAKPSEISEEVHINNLKAHGFDDRAILDAALVTGYFNFVNRMVVGLGSA